MRAPGFASAEIVGPPVTNSLPPSLLGRTTALEALTMSNSNRGRFVWHEYLAKDPKAAIAFYTETLGWKTQPFGDGGYTMWVSAQGPLGGVFPLPEAAAQMGAPPHWMAH